MRKTRDGTSLHEQFSRKKTTGKVVCAAVRHIADIKPVRATHADPGIHLALPTLVISLPSVQTIQRGTNVVRPIVLVAREYAVLRVHEHRYVNVAEGDHAARQVLSTCSLCELVSEGPAISARMKNELSREREEIGRRRISVGSRESGRKIAGCSKQLLKGGCAVILRAAHSKQLPA